MSFSTIFGVQGGPSADDKMVTMACSKNDFFTLQTESSTTNENSEEESGFNGFDKKNIFILILNTSEVIMNVKYVIICDRFPSGKRLAPVGANDEDAIEEKSNRLKMARSNSKKLIPNLENK